MEFTNQEISAISFRNQTEFTINDVVVETENVQQWLDKEKPYSGGTMYIFPDLNIAAFKLSKPEDGIEITAYADSVKPIYEKDITRLPSYRDLSFDEKAIVNDNEIAPTKALVSINSG